MAIKSMGATKTPSLTSERWRFQRRFLGWHQICQGYSIQPPERGSQILPETSFTFLYSLFHLHCSIGFAWQYETFFCFSQLFPQLVKALTDLSGKLHPWLLLEAVLGVVKSWSRDVDLCQRLSGANTMISRQLGKN